MNLSPTHIPILSHRAARWLLLLLLLLALLLSPFAKRITQLALPGLGVQPKTIIIEPQCPTPEQKAVIERNLKLYGASFSRQYEAAAYAKRLLAMSRSLGYPDPQLKDIQAIVRFLRQAMKLC